MQRRHRDKQAISLEDRLASFAKKALDEANHLPSGTERDQLLKTAHRADTASHIDQINKLARFASAEVGCRDEAAARSELALSC